MRHRAGHGAAAEGPPGDGREHRNGPRSDDLREEPGDDSSRDGSRGERRGGPGRVLRTLSGALLAVAAVSLGIVVLLALRGDPGGDALVASGDGAATAGPVESSPAVDEPVAGEPAPVAPTATEPLPAEPAPAEAAAPAEPPPPAVPADVTVTVLGVGGAEEAEPTAQQLRDAGWTVRLVASYRGSPPGATTLFHIAGREDAAALLAGQVGAPAVRPAPSSLSESDLTLVVSE